MKFWACEVKSGESFKVETAKGMVLRLCQANVGKFEKGRGNESVFLFVNVDGKECVLGTLSSKKLPQQQFELIFDRDFELSHDWKGGSVYFFGYEATNPQDIPKIQENGKQEVEKSAGDDYTRRFKDHKASRESEGEEDPPLKVVSGETCHSKHETSVATEEVNAKTLQKTDGNKGGVASPKDVLETSSRDRKRKRRAFGPEGGLESTQAK